MYTSGALILTNDGDFVFCLTHPKHEVTKTYNVTVKGIVQQSDVEILRKGVKIENYTTHPAQVKILKIDSEKNISRLQITIHEGKNRQVRKMIESLGKKVIKLKRERFAFLDLKGLKSGEYRKLSNKEIAVLYSLIKKN